MTIQELLQERNVVFASNGEHHHARPGWLAIRECPFCSSINYHLGFSISGNFFNCWKCGGHGVISTLVRLGVPFPDASAFFRGREPRHYREERERGELQEPPGRTKLLKSHWRYLSERFEWERALKIAPTWELEGIGRLGRELAWRIYIPISFQGKRVSWTTRSLNPDAKLRYISASAQQESINHRDVIYGIDMCQHVVIVVEGPADAWNVGPGAGALFGIDFSPAQVLQLASFTRRIICFDSSTEAQTRASELASQLAVFPGSTEQVELDAEDPGSAKPKEIKALRKMAGLS